MSSWLKDIARWQIGRRLYLSVPFTWLLPEARKLAMAHSGPTQAGGPAVMLRPDYLADVAEVNRPCPVEPLLFHNPLATFTSRGCVNACPFCAVPRLEGRLVEFDTWRPAPLVCDNNLLATSRKHFDKVIDSLKAFGFCDFNQGLEAALLTEYHAGRLAELHGPRIRFAFDTMADEADVADAIALCRKHGLNNISVYVLIGFNDTPEEARYRLDKVHEWKAQTSPMRYQPPDELDYNSHVAQGWTDKLLKDYMRWYSRSQWFGRRSISEYRRLDSGPTLFDEA